MADTGFTMVGVFLAPCVPDTGLTMVGVFLTPGVPVWGVLAVSGFVREGALLTLGVLTCGVRFNVGVCRPEGVPCWGVLLVAGLVKEVLVFGVSDFDLCISSWLSSDEELLCKISVF